jgi:hypothetical protein
MKLFKSLLVAPATLGLLAPIAATANEVTINDFNPAEELAVTNSRVDGLEARLNNFEAGSFSETTTASFAVDMYLGALDDDDAVNGVDADDDVNAGYSFQIDLNTSFTGEDSLDISLDAGTAAEGVAEFDGNSGGDGLTVDGVSYTFPLGDKATVIAGIDTDGSALFTTACVYGGPSNTLDDCGNLVSGITGGGATVGASYDFGNGLTAAFGAQTTENAVFTEESADDYAFNIAYTGDNYGLSLTYADVEALTINDTDVTDVTSYALQAYYTPEGSGLPSISAGYETGETTVTALGTDHDAEHWFVGLTWDEVGPGSAGIAIGSTFPTLDIAGVDASTMMEAYYSYPMNDGMTITPLIFTQSAIEDGVDDTTGVMVKTSFSF